MATDLLFTDILASLPEADRVGQLARMADEVHRLAPKQLVTVGMGEYQNLLVPGPDGRRVIDYSDLVSIHLYDAGAARRQAPRRRHGESR